MYDVDAVLEQVAEAEGLTDYGHPSFRDGLDVMAANLGSARLNAIGEAALRLHRAPVAAEPAAGHGVAPGEPGGGQPDARGTDNHRRAHPHRHHRAQPPARRRSGQPLPAGLGGLGLGAASHRGGLLDRPPLRGRPGRRQHARPHQPEVQGDPPRRARGRGGVRHPARPALRQHRPRQHVQHRRLRRLALRRRPDPRLRLPPAGAPGARRRLRRAVAAEVTGARLRHGDRRCRLPRCGCSCRPTATPRSASPRP